MKNIIICGSISAADTILKIQYELESMGHKVEIPEGVTNLALRSRTNVSSTEKAEDKIKHDLIRGYFDKMKANDIVLVVNVEKNSIPNYIGGNTLIEMAFAHVLHKPLYCLNPIPELPYTAEIIATQPIILNGDVSQLATR